MCFGGCLRARLDGKRRDAGKDRVLEQLKGVWSQCAQVIGARCGAEGGRGGVEAMDPGYTLTVDNLLKMISIQLRLKFNLPVRAFCCLWCSRSSKTEVLFKV